MNIKLNRVSAGLIVASVIAALAGITHASTITLSGSMSPNPHAIGQSGTGESFTLPTTYYDWLLGSGNKKLGGGITTTALSIVSLADYPNFTYTNGTSPTSATDENSTYHFQTGPFTLTIPVQAASGQIVLWLGASGANNGASFTADLPDTAGVEYSTAFAISSTREQWVLDYTSPVAQNMTISVNRGANTNAGFFAVANTVPEPSSVILLAGGIAFCLRRRICRQHDRNA